MFPENTLTPCQENALNILKTRENIFLTGVAGSGKSYLLKEYLKARDPKSFPVVASTGAAAIQIGGRTFHSFFGIGIMQGGLDATIERALKNRKVVNRLRKTQSIIIDEVSMLSGETLRAAECIARLALEKKEPWGGIRIIAVGDFAQLPPVTQYGAKRDWAFLDESWHRSQFFPVILKTIVRTKDEELLNVLNEIRMGNLSDFVVDFLNDRTQTAFWDFTGTRLFPHRSTTEKFNLMELEKLPAEKKSFETEYFGKPVAIDQLKKNAPVPEILLLKEGALVMIRQNDPLGRWVNGSLGTIRSIENEKIHIELQDRRRIAQIEKVSFELLDADGQIIATAKNFPLNLAYATTIHKAQGLTLDKVMADLRNLWEPGQAYVALSRVQTANSLFLTGWTPRSIQSDPAVARFYRGILNPRLERAVESSPSF